MLSLEHEAACFLPCIYIICSLETTWGPQVSILPSRRNQRLTGESLFWLRQSKAAISVVSYLASEAFLCLLSLFASPDAYLCRLYPFFSLCLAMVAQIRTSFWTEGGHMLWPALWIDMYLLRDDCSWLASSNLLDLWLQPFLICSSQ